MVHALDESWRVLARGGLLIDLRPRSTVFPVEAVSGAATVRLGEGSAVATAADDRATDEALQQCVRAGRFAPRHRTSFELHCYFESADEMAGFLGSGRAPKPVTPPWAEIDTAFRAFANRAGSDVRLRCTRLMTLAVYVRTDAAQPTPAS